MKKERLEGGYDVEMVVRGEAIIDEPGCVLQRGDCQLKTSSRHQEVHIPEERHSAPTDREVWEDCRPVGMKAWK
jgi:hypothetical protein